MNKTEKKPPTIDKKRKQYQKPSIIFEQVLEVKAGSPIDDSVDPFDLISED